MTDLGERLQGAAYAAGWNVVRALPESLARAGFRAGADLAARRGGSGVAQLRRNYARVVPQAGPAELDALVRDGVRSYARYWMETFRLAGMDHREIYRKVDEVMVGKPQVDAALERGKGLVLALPHTGNFDVSGVWLVGHCGPFTTVAERLKPESVYQRFLAHRESLGFEIVPTTGGDRAPYRVLMERLRENKIVCLPADRDLSRRGIPVSFFGEQTRMPAGPARLAAITGAELGIVDNSFTEDGWGLRIHTPIRVHGRDEVQAATQRMADGFAADIAANPVDWHMMQKLWLADLSEERRDSLAGPAADEPEEARESR
ncbi:MAG: phosphatidylinositol mannoside acyltransferase [Actinophytocola sp.]|uniref:phosphatidylinositol mannoside acyltransferase n=1 Tax=Actinophytocola sp. TaxID=1872138 RepID=UPI0013297C3B|nr:phosphatidylinositol mannoside acyltransferase [Actinophytocola sp.]MPZ80052.1 phosphatidylinositol mannoside acyltransferase [Actinophytocola sp.]